MTTTSKMTLSSAGEAQKLAALRAELAELESAIPARQARLVELQTEQRAFESRYLSVIGDRYDRLAEIEKEIARIQGLEFDEESENSVGYDADDEVGCGQNRLHGDKLKKLYHEVARKFHPDLASCDQERMHRTQLMVEVNRAYELGAEAQLEQLLEAGASLESIETSGAMSAEMILLVRRVAEAKEALVRIESQLDGITGSELYRLKQRVANADEFGVDLFTDLIAQVERQIFKAENRLHALQGVMMTS